MAIGKRAGVLSCGKTRAAFTPNTNPGFGGKTSAANDFPIREIAEAGGLLSYGPNLPDQFHRAVLRDKILRGTKPADLPVEQPTKFEFVINLKTASKWA